MGVWRIRRKSRYCHENESRKKKDRAHPQSDAVVDRKMNRDARITHKGMAKKRKSAVDFLQSITKNNLKKK
jgi:hypothetical protein